MERKGEIQAVPGKIKKEKPDEDINEFAETTMNELLGWYGYGATREDSKVPIDCSHPGSNSSDPESPKYAETCEWCGKPVDERNALTSSGAIFCSELCFSQSRRANFKKNKTCDWCRHVRHTVSYVDFQDGASQLQFCSDKCLNQYKMHIFCRETRAHLEMHPHLPEDTSSGGGLITPDLWLRNCKSPSPPLSPKSSSLPQTSPLPLITVARPSKLMENPDKRRSKIQKRRKRCPATVTSPSKSPPEAPQDLRVRHTPPPSERFREEPLRLPPALPSSLVPPVTIMVPYPVIIPLPLPVPIPIPIPCDRQKLDEALNGASLQKLQKANDPQRDSEKENQDEEKEEVEVEPVVVNGGRSFRKRRKAGGRLGPVKTKKTVTT